LGPSSSTQVNVIIEKLDDFQTFYFADGDADGFGDPEDAVITSCEPPAGRVTDDTDCNDQNASVNPGAAEICDSLDNDCDGQIDETGCNNPPAGAPTLIAPTGSGAASAPTYRWTVVGNATEYLLWVNNPSGANVIRTWYTSSVCNASECSVTPSTTLPDGTSRWWVMARNSAGTSPWSTATSFSVGTLVPPGTSTPLAPLGTITNATPEFQWSPVSGATEYLLWVNDATGNRHQQWHTAAAAGCAAGPPTPPCRLTLGFALAVGNGNFWILARNAAGTGPWSGAGAFTIAASGTPPAAPSLNAPIGPVFTTTPMYQWTAVQNATSYFLWVDGPNGNLIRRIYTSADTHCATGTECWITPSTPLAPGAHKWWVQAQSSGGNSPWSAAMSFTVQ
jgi:hypothetical protein